MIDDTLYDAFGQRQISTIFTQLNQYRVVLEVKPDFRTTPDDLNNIYVQSSAGGTVPLSAFTHVGAHQRAADDQSPGSVSGRQCVVQFGARRFAGPGGASAIEKTAARDLACRRASRPAFKARRKPFGVPGQRTVFDSRRAGDRLHRAWVCSTKVTFIRSRFSRPCRRPASARCSR